MWQPSFMTMAAARTVKLGTRVYPVVLPSARDPRLHLAMVIVSIHVLGQVALGFRVSVPQILAAILTCAVIEVVWVLRSSRQLVWPASAMLTGSGVALILRLVGMERGDHWSWRGWYLFALVAAVSLISKYLIRHRGAHAFNPSNFGLVLVFLVLGSNVVEPLDFWWAPLNPSMVTAYLIILTGGVLVTARLHLLAMATTFWVALAGAVAVLAASGHCITVAWAVQPVCGPDFWRVIVTSPEVLIFLFFMITDPKTIPARPAARIGFALCLAVLCTLLMAPQPTEFGAKVGLLVGLALLTPLRSLFDRARLLPAPDPARPGGLAQVMANSTEPLRLFASGAALGSLLVLLPVGIVAAGTPARDQGQALPGTGPLGLDLRIDPSTLPEVMVGREAAGLNGDARNAGLLAVALAENLAIEREAMLRADTSLLRAADDGERLLAMERKVQAAATAGRFEILDHRFDSLHLELVFTDGPQGGAGLGLEASGTVRRVVYDTARAELERAEAPFRSRFVLRQGAGGRWVILSETRLAASA
jgi:Na+-transporting NADH:ubiquinone oxidoreductase subunit NqrB